MSRVIAMGCYPNWCFVENLNLNAPLTASAPSSQPSPSMGGAGGRRPDEGEMPRHHFYRLLWFKQPPNLFPGQRFPFEQRLFDSFHPGATLF